MEGYHGSITDFEAFCYDTEINEETGFARRTVSDYVHVYDQAERNCRVQRLRSTLH